MPLSKGLKRKARKLLSALDPSKKGELAIEQLKEDVTDGLVQVSQKLEAKIRGLKDELSEVDMRLSNFPNFSEILSIRSNLEQRLSDLEKEEIPNIQTQMQDIVSADIDIEQVKGELAEQIEQIRREFRTRLSNLGGGNANRDIRVNSNSVLGRFTDINFLNSSTVGWATSVDNVNRRVNFMASVLTGGGTPGGSDTQVQFNDGGVFGGDSALTWNKTTNTLLIGLAAGSGTVTTPSASVSGENAGFLTVTTGTGQGSGQGGDMSFGAGNGGATGIGGSAEFFGGNGTTGGSVFFVGGQGEGVGGVGGSIEVTAGAAPDGTPGELRLLDPASGVGAVMDMSNITSANKDFSFPDQSGTLALETSASGSFTTVDGKTVTVVNGIITSIV